MSAEKKPAQPSGSPPTPPSGPGAPSRPGAAPAGADSSAEKTDAAANPVGTAAMISAVILLIFGIVMNLVMVGQVTDAESLRSFVTVWDLVGVILGTATLVMGVVGLASKRTPRAGALVGVAVGTYVFLTSLAGFVGTLVSSA